MKPEEPSSLVLGHPRFATPELAALAAAQGAATAWQRSVEGGLDQAAAALDGDFAFAERRADGSASLAIDRFAVRSLCWRLDGGRLRFAARADELAGENPELDPQALFDYLFHHAIASPRTAFAGVHRLPPGHVAEFADGRIDVRPYWQPAFAPAPAAETSFDALAEEFRALLKDAVRAELEPGKAGCFLSGGTDSSTVTGMIRAVTGEAPATYSIGFDAAGYDEMEFARTAARHFGAEHHEYYVTPADLVRSIPSVAAAYDQPFGNSSALPAYYCARMAAEDGVRKILAGDGGDELFGGNTRYAKQRVFNLYDGVPAGLRRGLIEPLADSATLKSLPLLSKASSYVTQARLGLPLRLESYNLLLRLGIERVLTPAFRAAVDTGGPLADQKRVWDGIRAPSLVDHQLAYDWRYTLAESDLPKVVGTTALAGIDVGFPMLDRRLHDFSMRLPASYKLRGLKLRWFFKQALRGFLPDAVIAKKKQGFGLPFGVWATRDAALAALARDALGSLSTRGLIEPAFIRALLDEHLHEHPGFYGEMVWILLMLEQWLQARAPRFRLN